MEFANIHRIAPEITIMQRVSQHFTLAEATVTSTGLDNTPTDAELSVIQATAMQMETLRQLLGAKPIVVNSWFRSDAVNNAVGGVSNSQHRLGEAVDFTCHDYGTDAQVVQLCKDNVDVINYDQLILEPSWVHISFLTNPDDPRTAPRHQFIDFSNK